MASTIVTGLKRQGGGAARTPSVSARARSFLARVAAVTLALVVAFAAPALAGGGGMRGDPQPELALFVVSKAGGGAGSGAVLSDGTMVLVAPTGGDPRTATVCVLHPGDRSCASTATLHAYSKGSEIDTIDETEILYRGSNDVTVVGYDIGYLPPFDGGAVVFNSTNGGKSFSAETVAGNISSIGAATYAGGEIVVATYGSGSLNVQAFPPSPSSPVTAMATPRSGIVENVGLTTYKGGVLVASDDGTNTYVEYAKAGSDFNDSSSYSPVGTFANQTLSAISGDALLTNAGGGVAYLRFFDGSSFGSAHALPTGDTAEVEPTGFTLEEVNGSVPPTVHVFFVSRGYGYDIMSETTKNGKSWSPIATYNTAITSTDVVPVLNSQGSGICFESAGMPTYAQPILNPQAVHISLAKSEVTDGTSTILSGTVKPATPQLKVTLQRRSGGLWYDVTTAKQGKAGQFSFVIPGKTDTYRVVSEDLLGYYLYGYSNEVTLTAVPKA